jgi:magnesium transporter
MPEENPVTLDQLAQLHPADLADQLQRLDTDEAQSFLRQLPRPLAAKVVDELEDEQVADLVAHFTAPQLAELLREMPPDAAADLLGELHPTTRREALAALPPASAAPIKVLLRYPEDTAGGIMTDRVISLRGHYTIQQCQELLRSMPEQRPEDVSYLYVTDEDKHLIGVISLRDLVFRQPHHVIGDIINREVRAVRVDADQEEIARQFEHYHFLGLPVVDDQGRLMGVVRASDALHVAQAEATEDMQLMVGLSGEERALTPWRKSILKRLPWLCVNLGTAFCAAAVVGFFESTIAQWTALAIFLPIVAGQGGNAGMQTLTVIIRDMALGEISTGDGRKALFKEMVLGAVNGLAIGLVVGCIGFLWQGDIRLGLVAGAAMLLNQLAAAMSGVLIPFGLKFFKVDPALASSIFVTTVTDVAGFFFFLGLATLAIRWGL